MSRQLLCIVFNRSVAVIYFNKYYHQKISLMESDGRRLTLFTVSLALAEKLYFIF